MSMGHFWELWSPTVRADFSKNMPAGEVEKSKRAFVSALRSVGDAEFARATLLQGGDASRGSSTEFARATLLQRGDASRGSWTEFARATLLQRL